MFRQADGDFGAIDDIRIDMKTEISHLLLLPEVGIRLNGCVKLPLFSCPWVFVQLPLFIPISSKLCDTLTADGCDKIKDTISTVIL